MQKELTSSGKYRDTYSDMIILKIQHLKALLNHKILAYIDRNYYLGIDMTSQKPGSSAMKPETSFQVCSYFLAFACFLWEAGNATLTCGHGRNNIKRKSLFLTYFSLPVFSCFSLCVQNTLFLLL